MKSNYDRQGIDVESCYRPGGGCDITPPKPPDPPKRPRRDDPYTPPPSYPTPTASDNADQEAARKRAEAERARVAAEKKRKEEDKVQRDKAEILKSLKGASSGDLGLKGVDSSGTNSLGLKGTEETPKPSGLSKVMPIYWRTVSVPAACVVADQLKAGAVCSVIDARDLLRALNGPNATHELAKLLLRKAMKKALVVSLGAEGLESKADLVNAMYEAEGKMVDEVYRSIVLEMSENPAKQAWMTEQAKLDAEAVARLKQTVFSEKQANVQASLNYFQRNPTTQGIKFNCTSACRQLLQAARGMGVLE